MDLVTTQSGSQVQLFAGNFPRVMKPATIASGQGVLVKGTVLGVITASGKFGVFTDGGSGGLNVARAILAENVDATSADVACSVYLAGDFNQDALTGLTAQAVTNFRGTPIFIGKAV